MIPAAESIQPTANAVTGLIRREGSGLSAVRFIKASRSISINWLKAAEPNAAAAVPIRVWKRVAHSSDIPFRASRYPNSVVTSTKKFSRTFISTLRS